MALLTINLAWTTMGLGGYRAETMVVTSALTGLLLAGYFLKRVFSRATQTHPAGWLLLPFLIYAAANAAFVTPVPWLGWRDWLLWAQMIAVFWVALNDLRSAQAWRVLAAAVAAMGVAAVALACYQRFVQPDWLMLGRVQAGQFIGRASGPFGIPNSLGAMLGLLIPPVIAWAFLRRASAVERVLGGWLAAVFLSGLVLTVSRGAWISLGLALVAWPLLMGNFSWRRRLGASALVAGVALAAGAALYFAVPGVNGRFNALVQDAGERTRPIMWRGAWGIFCEHPLFGGGAGAYDVLFEKYRPGKNYQDEPVWAHNDYLNTLADYGAVGFALFFGAVAMAAQRCLRKLSDAPVCVHALAVGLLAFALQTFTDFNLKIPALAMLAAVIAAALVRATWPVEPQSAAPSRARRFFMLAAATATAAATALLVMPRYRAEAGRSVAREAIDQLAMEPLPPQAEWAALSKARTTLAKATARDPANGQAWADLSYATALLARHEPARIGELGRSAEAAAERALNDSSVVAEFWIRRGVARDLQRRQHEADADFARAVELAPQSAPVWFYEAFHLSLQPACAAEARRAVETCLQLDPGNRVAITLRQRLVENNQAP